MSDATASVLALLEASRRRRVLAAEAARTTLAGLEAVHVQVEPLNADAERAGLRPADMRAEVEAALRAGGIAVVAPPALFADVAGAPFLHLDVMTVPLDGRYAYSLRLELWQEVRLVRRPGLVSLGLTWSAPQVIGTIAGENLTELRDLVRAAAAGFVEECRLASSEAA